jgi:hypothetical protein
MTTQYTDLFKLLIGVSPASPDDFRIITDPLAKVPFCQLYRQSLVVQGEFEQYIQKRLANG